MAVVPATGWFNPVAVSSKSATSTLSRLADAEEVVHVDGAALGLGHPLGDQRNGDDAVRARVGGDAGAVAPEPGLEGERLDAPSPGAAPNVT